MKIDRTLLEQMKNAYRSVKEAVDTEEIDIEETMSEVDVKNFNETIEYDNIPDGIKNLLKFPYIPNVNVIDEIKYDKGNKQLLIKFKLTYKKLSELFFLRANTDRLVGKLSSSNHDRLFTVGFENMRLLVIFQLVDNLEFQNEPEVDIEAIKESVDVEETMSVACSSFKQAMSSLKNTIGLVFTEITNEDEMGLLKKIWQETQKDINTIIK